MTPKVTVVTVTYNCKNIIADTIDSVHSQTYSNIEYIIVDGASSDGTLQVLNSYSDYVDIIISEPDKGIYDAMNKGIKISSGEWILFMNAGDRFYSNETLNKVFSNAIPEGIKVIYGDVAMKFDDDNIIINRVSHRDISKLPFCLCHQSTLTSGKYLRDYPYDLSYRICADAKSFYNIMRSGYGFHYVPVPISIYEAYDGMSSKNIYRSYLEQSKIQGANYCSFDFIISYIKIILKLIPAKLLSKKRYARLMKAYIGFLNR